MMSRKVVAKFSEPDPEPVEVLVSSIVTIGESMKRIDATRLTHRALVTLIQADTGISRGNITRILECLSSLEKSWLKPIKQ